MMTFDGVTIADEATGRPVTGVAVRVYDVATDAPIQAYLDGLPVTLVTNLHGYVPTFQTDDGIIQVRLEAGPGRAYRWAFEALSGAVTLGGRALAGTGSPEGVVTAGVGTSYRDTAGTNGVFDWIKASGAAAAGWKPVGGDTGWRDVSTLLGAGLAKSTANGRCRIRRVGELVSLDMHINVTAASITTLLAVPSGFRPTIVGAMMLAPELRTNTAANAATPITAAVAYFSTVSNLRASAALANPSTFQYAGSWFAGDPWPTALPGTAL